MIRLAHRSAEEDVQFRANAVRVLLLCLGIGLVVGVSGAAHTPGQLAQWVIEVVCGAAFGLTAARWLVPVSWFTTKTWAAALVIAGAITLPMTGIVLGCLVLLNGVRFAPQLVGAVAPSVFGTSFLMTAIALLTRRPPTRTHAAPASAPPPKFLSRLPPRLAGAEIFAVEAEDHYLRLHTSLGQDLILMRLGDAIAELEGVEGAQTHRSWWVARAAVTGAERADGRATLTLKDGAEVPVSRGFAKQLRGAGWF